MNNKKFPNNDFLYESNKKEKSIVDFLNLALMDKKFLIFITGIGVFITIIFSTKPQRVWEGKFQMIVPLNNLWSSLKYSNAENLISNQDFNNIDNDIQILKSSSFLRPIFDGIQDQENKNILESNQEFINWLENSIRIEKKSSFLSVYYKDENKDNILPTLKSISKQYKLYFENNKKESLQNITNYYDQEIIELVGKTNQSLKKVRDFADQNDLKEITILPFQEKEEVQKFLSIISSSSKINGKKITQDVLFEYRELLQNYFKNKEILNELEEQKRDFEFITSISLKPIEIITEPTIISSSVTPSRFVILIFGSMLSLLLGILFSIYKNRNKSNLISDLSELKTILNLPLIEEINLSDNESSLESLKLFTKFNLSPNDLLGIIPVGNIKKININDFFGKLNSCHQNTEIISPNNLLKANISSYKILIISKNTCNEKDLQKLNYKLKYFGEKVLGWILIEDDTV